MIAKNIAAVALIGILAASAIHGTGAAAQEAITLERIGAVSFASPAGPGDATANAPRSAPTDDVDTVPMMLERIGAVRMGRPEAGATVSDSGGAGERPVAARTTVDASAREMVATFESAEGAEPTPTR